MLNICIGYDKNESVAYHVLAHSIMRRASRPVCIIPLYLPQLQAQGIYTRSRDPNQTTDFTYSRFLAPWFGGTGVHTIFLDCDMLCLSDIYEMEQIARNHTVCDVLVVKHNYTPKPGAKFLGQPQSTYPCKNWSSVMLFNGYRSAVQRLTPDYINTVSAMDLHQFRWCRSPDDIGELPVEWNHLVGEYEPNPNAKIVHFTRGGPWFDAFADCEYAQEWREELNHAMSAKK